jgi:hypothetical protein
MAAREPSRPVQLRLPAWAAEFVDKRAREQSTSRSTVMIQAIGCLQQHELEQLMEQGYREMAQLDEALAEQNLSAGTETWPTT